MPGLIYGVDENRNTLKIMVSIDQKVLLKGVSIFLSLSFVVVVVVERFAQFG